MPAMGSVGLSSGETIPSDLETIYQGGEFFLDRMKAMGVQVALSQKALADLNVGKDIVAANAAAQSALADATKAKADAEQALADAKLKAEALVADAQANASAIVNAANASSAAINEKAAAVRASADDYASSCKAKADAALADAKAKQSLVNDQIDKATKAQAAADNSKIAYDAATQAAQDAKEAYLTKIAKLQAVIGAES